MTRVFPLLVLLAAACSSDGDAPPRMRLTVVVLEAPLLASDTNDLPISDAEVAFDPPENGARMRAIVDENGRATFDVDEAALRGGASVTVFSPNHVSYSALDVTSTEVVVVVPLLDRAAVGTVLLSGAISGRSPLGSSVDLSASKLARLGHTNTLTDTFSFRVPQGLPFFLIGHEQLATGSLVKSFRIDVPAKDADARLDVDLTSVAELTPRRVFLRLERPPGMSGKLEANVVSADSSLLIGTQITESGGEVEIAVVDTDLAGERAVTRAVVIADDGARSVKSELAVVADGTTWSDLPAPPTVIDASRLQTDPIPFEGVPDGADLRVDVIAGGKLGWILVGPRGGTRSKTVKLPPSFGVEFPALIAVNISAQLDPVDLGPRRVLYRRVAVSRDVVLHR